MTTSNVPQYDSDMNARQPLDYRSWEPKPRSFLAAAVPVVVGVLIACGVAGFVWLALLVWAGRNC